MNRLITFFINRSFIVNLVVGFVCLAGVFALTSLKRDLVPPLQWQRIVVKVSLPGATPKEIEKFLTYQIESSVKGMPGIEKFTSISEPGRLKLYINYRADFDLMSEAVEQVRSRIASIRGQLPEGIRSIEVERSRINNVFLFYVGFEKLDVNNYKHRQFYESFEKEIGEIPGVVFVRNSLPARDIYVEMDLKKLKQHEITVGDVRQVLRQSLRFASIGQVKVGDERYAVEIEKLNSGVEQVGLLPIRSNRTGQSVYIRDVAKVGYKLAEVDEVYFINGHSGASMGIFKDTSSDTIDLKPLVMNKIAKFNKKAPEGVRIVHVVDGPQFIERQLDVLVKNGVIGFLLVLLVLMLFINWRTAIMTALGLPLAYFGTMIVLLQMGFKIDLLSVVGLILVIGILVDDAIIVSERYIEYLTKGWSPQKSAFQAVRDLLVPVSGTVLTTIVAFSPLILIRSDIGNMLFAIPVVVIVALTLSWIESFFVLPNHLAHFVKEPPNAKKINLFLKIKNGYQVLLGWTLRFRYLALLTTVVLIVVAGFVATKKMKHNFNLDISPEAITVYAFLKESGSLENTLQQIKPIEEFLLSLPKEDVENITASVGWVWADGRPYRGHKFAKIRAYVNRHSKYPSKLKKRIKNQVEEKMKALKGERFSRLSVGIDRHGGDEKKEGMVSVLVEGSERVDFLTLQNDLMEVTKPIEVLQDWIEEPDLFTNSWKFQPDAEKMASYKLDVYQVARQTRSYFTPDEVLETRIDGENHWVYTEVKGRKKLTFEQLNKLEIVTDQGTSVPTSFLGSWKTSKTLSKIHHRNGRRVFTFDFKVNDKKGNIQVAKKALTEALVDVQKKYPDYKVEVVNTDEDEAKSQAWAFKVAVICILGVLLVMALILGSLTQPILVGLPIPFGLIGIVFALYFHNLPLGLMALVGLVGTVGVAVNASIVMCDHINQLHKTKGFLNREVLIEGASDRLRAILLTTLTTLGGVFPMAYGFGGESGFTQPLAFSMAWGLSFATILTLFVLPALLEVREDVLGLFGRIKFFNQKQTIIVKEELILNRGSELKESRDKEL